MKKITFLKITLMLLITPFFGYSQDRTIEGSITSEGEPLPGVNVLIKGTSQGTISDVDGKYSISASSGEDVIIFSFIGFETQEVAIGSQSKIDVSLVESSQQLSEVLVTALGVKREEKSLGYAVQKIEGDAVGQTSESNIVNSLSGKVAGVQVTGASGNLGGSSRILIRGVNSVSGNNQPLFVVDGTPIDNSNFNSEDTQTAGGGRDYGNAAQDINPEDIESISVLKGPSAAALYGSRASNGVIMITTKGGSARKGIGVSINSTTTFDKVYVLPDYQDEYGAGYVQQFETFSFDPSIHPAEYSAFDGQPMINYQADESWGPRMDGQMVRHWDSWYPGETFGELRAFSPHPDNIKDFYQTGRTLKNSVAISGGNDKGTFRVSFTNMDQKGTFPNSELQRNTFSVNTSYNVTDKLTAKVVANFVNTKALGRPATGGWTGDGPMSVVSSFNLWHERQLDMDRLRNYKMEDGTIRHWNITSPTDLSSFWWVNPFFEVYESYNNDERNRVFGNASLSYDVSKDLKITGFARTDFYSDRREDRVPDGHENVSMYEEDVYNVRENNFEFLAQYQKMIGSFSIAVNAGANHREMSFYQNKGQTVGGLSVPNYFNLEASIDRPSITDYKSSRTVNSVYGSASIGFKETLYLDATLRNDWSSTLPASNNSYMYPSVSASFVFSEMIPANNFVSFGKIRAGWAQVGNDTDPYRLQTIYSPDDAFGSSPIFFVPNTLNNSDLKPETNTSYEVGLDMRFFNGRVGFDLTYYDNVSTDQILNLPVSSTSGFEYLVVNAGKITNNGVELMLTTTPIRTSSGFEWNVIFNWAKNNNKVVELAPGQDNYVLGSQNGVTVNARVGEAYGSLEGSGYLYNDNGQKVVDEDGFYVRETSKVLGSVMADYTGGITNSFYFKGFSLSALIDFQKGGVVHSYTNGLGQYSGLLLETAGLNDKGTPQRDPVDAGGGILADGVNESGEANTVYVESSDYWKHLLSRKEAHVYDASFVKFRELKIGYNLPKAWFEKNLIQSMTIGLVGRNLAILHKNVPNIDPESALGSGNIQGIEEGQLPSVRSMGFNVSIKL
ncbi:MAG: SusC/RagA family TonB-linked outer membrane protein [Thalassobius sp.]|nr:SusC/RagA family TonB-linked outer membrane protein [Thalassovita sp.]